jgi:hypothetical protein
MPEILLLDDGIDKLKHIAPENVGKLATLMDTADAAQLLLKVPHHLQE